MTGPAGRIARSLPRHPRRRRRPLRPAGPLLGGLLQGPAERLLLPRPLLARLRPDRRRPVGPAAAEAGPLRGRGRGGRLRPRSAPSSTRPAASSGTSQVIRSNEFHTYFRVNSVFWDPNIYGRYLALVMVIATAPLLWVRDRRAFCPADGAARRALVRPRPDLLGVELHRPAGRPGGAGGAALELALDPGGDRGRPGRDPRHRRRLRQARASTSSSAAAPTWSAAALELWTERPLWGYGSGSFQEAYRDHRDEQGQAGLGLPHRAGHGPRRAGPVGFALYVALVVVALWTMGAGMWSRGRRAGAALRRPRRRARRLRRPAGPHDGLRRLLRGPDHLGAAGRRRLAGGGRRARGRGPRPGAVQALPDVGIPASPGHHRRRLHRGQHPLEADRGRAAAALHALPDPRTITAPPRSSSPPSSRSASSSASA